MAYVFGKNGGAKSVETIEPSKKILYCASTTGHLKNFHLPYLQMLARMGYEVIACAEQKAFLPGVSSFLEIPFCKRRTSLQNLKSLWRLYQYFRTETIAVVSVHTTLAAAIVRAAVWLLPRRKRPVVLYTCHGYLFSRQDGWRAWKYVLPEKLCAGVTDCLLVMNQEDETIAREHHLYHKKLQWIPGMGVDFSKWNLAESKETLRQRYGILEKQVVFVFAGEFSNRKNQSQLIAAFAKAFPKMPNAKLILAGQGQQLEACKAQAAQLQIAGDVDFPGQVQDMPTLYHCSDICVSASRIEGLPFNIMEAMYCGLPCIASEIKGHRDLLQQGQTGYLYRTEEQLVAAMITLYQEKETRERMGAQARKKVLPYRLEMVQPIIEKVYEEVCEENV